MAPSRASVASSPPSPWTGSSARSRPSAWRRPTLNISQLPSAITVRTSVLCTRKSYIGTAKRALGRKKKKLSPQKRTVVSPLSKHCRAYQEKFLAEKQLLSLVPASVTWSWCALPANEHIVDDGDDESPLGPSGALWAQGLLREKT